MWQLPWSGATVVNGVHASEGGQQLSLVHLRAYSTLLNNRLVTHDYIAGVPYGSNLLGKSLLEPLELMAVALRLCRKWAPILLAAKRLHVGWQGQSTYTLVVAHLLETNE